MGVPYSREIQAAAQTTKNIFILLAAI
jgi:hypothetical protein